MTKKIAEVDNELNQFKKDTKDRFALVDQSIVALRGDVETMRTEIMATLKSLVQATPASSSPSPPPSQPTTIPNFTSPIPTTPPPIMTTARLFSQTPPPPPPTQPLLLPRSASPTQQSLGTTSPIPTIPPPIMTTVPLFYGDDGFSTSGNDTSITFRKILKRKTEQPHNKKPAVKVTCGDSVDSSKKKAVLKSPKGSERSSAIKPDGSSKKRSAVSSKLGFSKKKKVAEISPPLEDESKQRIVALIREAASLVTLDEVKNYHQGKLPSTHALSSVADAFIREIVRLNGIPKSIVFDRDRVFLTLRPYRQVTVAKRLNLKLVLRYYGPFTVLAKVGSVASRWQLPDSTVIHPVFHVSQLKAAVDTHSVEPTLPDLDRAEICQPEEVSGVRDGENGLEVLISWLGIPPGEDTWELADRFIERFPDFHLEDKVSFGGRGIDTNRGSWGKVTKGSRSLGQMGRIRQQRMGRIRQEMGETQEMGRQQIRMRFNWIMVIKNYD